MVIAIFSFSVCRIKKTASKEKEHTPPFSILSDILPSAHWSLAQKGKSISDMQFRKLLVLLILNNLTPSNWKTPFTSYDKYKPPGGKWGGVGRLKSKGERVWTDALLGMGHEALGLPKGKGWTWDPFIKLELSHGYAFTKWWQQKVCL